jgi:hypothetical protein
LNSTRKKRHFFIFFLLGLYGYSLFSRILSLNGDSSMYIYAGDLVLSGQKPFLDFFDINPPLIVYLSAISNWFAYHIGVYPVFLYKLFTAILCLGSWFYAWSLSEKSNMFPKENTFIFAIVSLILQIMDVYLNFFGQRDHLFASLLLPYLILNATSDSAKDSWGSRFFSFLITLGFGITVAFKPYFLLFLVALELFISLFVKKSWRSLLNRNFFLVLSIQLIYYLWLLSLPGQQGDYFWKTHIPMVMHFYEAFDYSSISYPVFIIGSGPIISLIALAFGMHHWVVLSKFQKLSIFLFGSTLLLFVLQFRWFPYHLAPINVAISFSFLAFALGKFGSIALKTNNKILAYIQNFYLMVIFACFVFYAYTFLYISEASGKRKNNFWQTRSILQGRVKEGDSILPLTPTNSSVYTIASIYKLKIGSRYLFQYPLAFFGTQRFATGKLFFDPNDDYLNSLEFQYFDNLREDIDKFKPKVIWFFETKGHRPAGLPKGFPIFEYLDQVGFIKTIENSYFRVQAPDGYLVFLRKN